jgi:putative ABC transport system permease protein
VSQNIKLALRQFARAPGFTAIAIATLAVAIGVNAAVFALVNGMVLRPVVRVRPAEVVNLYGAWKDSTRDYRRFTFQEYRALRERTGNEVFSDVAAVHVALLGVGRDRDVQRTLAVLTSENFFALTGGAPALGRFYDAAACLPNANISVVVVSHGFWKRMGSRPDFVGSTLRVNGRPFTVIGVAQEGFSGVHALIAPDVWLPLGVFGQLGGAVSAIAAGRDLAAQRNHPLNLVARLRPGLDLPAARARLPLVEQRLTALVPDESGRLRDLQLTVPPRVSSLNNIPTDDGPIALIAGLLMAMAAAVLLIACLNLANMLLARGTARSREMAVRLALGAGRAVLVRQLLWEGLLLGLAGGAAGLLLSVWANELLAHYLNGAVKRMSFTVVVRLQPDLGVVGGTFVCSLVATLLFSLGPALRTSRIDLVKDLKRDGGEPAGGSGLSRFFSPRHLLVMSQLALSLVLLFGGGLFLRAAIEAGRVPLGFDPAGGVVAEIDYTLGEADEVAVQRSRSAALERAAHLPGVRAAALATLLPYGNDGNDRRVRRAEDWAPTGPGGPDTGALALFTAVSAGYFDTVGVRLLRGRDFTPAEATTPTSPPTAIIDERLAAALFPHADPVGRRLRFTVPPTDGTPAELEVVGVVASHRHQVMGQAPPRLFVPLGQSHRGDLFLHVRYASPERGALLAATPALRQALRGVDPDLPILSIVPFTDVLEQNAGLWVVRLGAVLFGVFGALALLLAAVGVYGVKSYAVARRTREIGIRMALGSRAGDVFALVMRQAVLQTALALGVGLLLALATGRVLARIVYQVSPTDPLSLLVATTVLAAASLLASVLPARRATRVSPMSALRSE